MDLRKSRGLNQKLFLIEILDSTSEYQKKFKIMGSTGNVYNVTIENNCRCDCPDFLKRAKRCKHIYFVLIKLMKIEDEMDKDIYFDDELLSMFKNIPLITSNLIVSSGIKKIYDQLNTNCKNVTKMKQVDDLCPICLEDLNNGEELDFCKYSCGKPIHKICYSMWTLKKNNTCVFCYADWNSNYLNVNS